jgi:hypothetical protein
MKEFPKFSESKIQFEVTQPQMKLLLCAARAFREQLDADGQGEQLKSILDDAERSYGFKFIKPYQLEPETFKTDLELVMDDLCDAFVSKKSDIQEMLNQKLTDFYQQNFDPEILNLANGEILRVAND